MPNTAFVRRAGCCVALATVSLTALHAATAQAQTAPAAAPAPAAPAAAAAPAAVTLPAPSMSAPLALNPSPYHFDVGPLGTWYVSGALTGIGMAQSDPLPGDQKTRVDLTNGQVFVQKIDGILQFYVQAGIYTLPTVGASYVSTKNALNDYFGPVPVAYVKLVPNSSFTIEAGKLPTLIGDETNFTFQNINIERGLLWNEEPAISRGVQVTYTKNTVTANVSLTDGYYSNTYNWLTGSLAWAMNSASTLTFAGGGNLGHTSHASFATPVPQNNSSIYNIIYTYTNGPWLISPYLQYSDIKSNPGLGYTHSGETYSGALLVNYAFNPKFSLGGRVEYISTTGTPEDGAPNLLYGAGSKAFTLTLTPTYQFSRFYVRGDISYVGASSVADGSGFGSNGSSKDQVRGIAEIGVLF